MKSPKPSEEARLTALRAYDILDTGPEKSFDDLTSLASHVCETPIALISLVDSDRQWFKSRIGLDVSEMGVFRRSGHNRCRIQRLIGDTRYWADDPRRRLWRLCCMMFGIELPLDETRSFA